MFKSRTLLLLVVALMLLSITVVACSGEGGASATSPAAQALIESARTKDAKEVAASDASAATTSTELNVAAAFYTPDDLAAMTQATAATDDGDVAGTSLIAVLEAAGLGDADTIVITAADGYSAEVAVAEIDDTAVVAVEDGKFNVVIPTVAKSAWVDDVVSISTE